MHAPAQTCKYPVCCLHIKLFFLPNIISSKYAHDVGLLRCYSDVLL